MSKISQGTIDSVKSLDIVDVLRAYLPDLKKKAANWECLSPFNIENTPSFSVSPSKQIWKDFSSDKGGDAIAFVMQYKNLEFIPAIEEIANTMNITISYEDESPAQAKKRVATQQKKKTTKRALDFAHEFYKNQAPYTQYMKHRMWQDMVQPFGMGYTPRKSNDLVMAMLAEGYSEEDMMDASLANKNDKGDLYDFFWGERIIIPFYDKNSKLIAFTSRDTKPATAESKKYKYINSRDSIWNKRDHLYGLSHATNMLDSEGKKYNAIDRQEFLYIVEGQPDAIAMHRCGMHNVAAIGNKRLTKEQIKIIVGVTKHVVLVPDMDAKKNESTGKVEHHGVDAFKLNAEDLLAEGIHVQWCPPASGKDVDEYLLKASGQDVKEFMQSQIDYLNGYIASALMGEATDGPHAKAKAVTEMARLVELIPNEITKMSMYDSICATWGDFKKMYKLKKNNAADFEHLQKMGKNKRQEFEEFGFFEEDGVWHTYKGKSKIRICNFTIEILYFVFTAQESKYVCRLRNLNGVVRIAPISTDDFVSVNIFAKVVGRYGNFIFEAGQEELNKLRVKLFSEVKMSEQPKFMGYNEHGNFYTWANGLWYNGRFCKADKYGIVAIERPIASLEDFVKIQPESQIKIKGETYVINNIDAFIEEFGDLALKHALADNQVILLAYYYLPFSTRYNMLDDEDDFEMIRKIRLADKAPRLSFEEWATLMHEVYGDNGKIMIAFYLASLMRSVIYKVNNNYFPILMNFGLRQSGKSKAAESIACMFGEVIEDGVNLESGSTATGIRRYMAGVQDSLIWLNEYKNTLPGPTIGMLKGIADGSGKITGVKTGGNEFKNYKPKSGAVMCGQDLPTQDPALLSRGIICEYSKDDNTNVKSYDKLKKWEKQGGGTYITCQLINHRQEIAQKYERVSIELREAIKDELESETGARPDDRAVLNTISILAPIKILLDSQAISLPFAFEALKTIAKSKVKFQQDVQQTSDDVEQYLFVLQSLPTLRDGEHYKIAKIENPKCAGLFLRVKAIHNFYLEGARRQGITPLGISTIRNYLKRHSTFIVEHSKGVDFDHLANPTSAIVLDYDKLVEQGIEFKTGAIGEASTDTTAMKAAIFRALDAMPKEREIDKASLMSWLNDTYKMGLSEAELSTWLLRYKDHSQAKYSIENSGFNYAFKLR